MAAVVIGVGFGFALSGFVQPAPRWYGIVVCAVMFVIAIAFRTYAIPYLVQPL
jgi:hypothetical protein